MGRWPWMIRFYKNIEAMFGAFIGRSIAPALVESGIFVGGMTLLLQWLLGLSLTSVLPIIAIIVVLQLLWHLLHIENMFSPNRLRITFYTTTITSLLLLASTALSLGYIASSILLASEGVIVEEAEERMEHETGIFDIYACETWFWKDYRDTSKINLGHSKKYSLGEPIMTNNTFSVLGLFYNRYIIPTMTNNNVNSVSSLIIETEGLDDYTELRRSNFWYRFKLLFNLGRRSFS
jgi:hypothetical protein